ncbi:hypothetical protein C4588_01655 [Candidatus Parcubacteria bacterium]|nr:MAG: hypothetical protein C4588_01655 [Candidatus Parcubacteria bacterium]
MDAELLENLPEEVRQLISAFEEKISLLTEANEMLLKANAILKNNQDFLMETLKQEKEAHRKTQDAFADYRCPPRTGYPWD